jgi:hypothetical protein
MFPCLEQEEISSTSHVHESEGATVAALPVGEAFLPVPLGHRGDRVSRSTGFAKSCGIFSDRRFARNCAPVANHGAHFFQLAACLPAHLVQNNLGGGRRPRARNLAIGQGSSTRRHPAAESASHHLRVKAPKMIPVQISLDYTNQLVY